MINTSLTLLRRRVAAGAAAARETQPTVRRRLTGACASTAAAVRWSAETGRRACRGATGGGRGARPGCKACTGERRAAG